jgi:hypothetical protein
LGEVLLTPDQILSALENLASFSFHALIATSCVELDDLTRQSMTKLKRIQARARELAKSGKFHGWSPIAFELRFEDGFEEARQWLYTAIREMSLIAFAAKLEPPRMRLLKPPLPVD